MSLSDRRGFALIAALWLLVALSIIGLEFGLRARARRLEVANATEATVARASAEGGLDVVYARLVARIQAARDFGANDPNLILDPWRGLTIAPPGKASRLAEKPDTLHLGASLVDLNLRDAGGSLNLNLSSVDDLRRFFLALRVDLGAADRLAQAIADWRDVDQLYRPRGAEREQYLKDGAPVLPADAPFTRVSDLRYVRGMTAQLYRSASPFLALQGTGRINLNAAPRPVVLALPGMSEAAVAVLERRRDAGRPLRSLADLALELPEGPKAELQAAAPILQGRVLFETQEILTTVTARTTGSPVAVQAQGLFVRGGDAVFLTWRRID